MLLKPGSRFLLFFLDRIYRIDRIFPATPDWVSCGLSVMPDIVVQAKWLFHSSPMLTSAVSYSTGFTGLTGFCRPRRRFAGTSLSCTPSRHKLNSFLPSSSVQLRSIRFTGWNWITLGLSPFPKVILSDPVPPLWKLLVLAVQPSARL